MSSVYVVCWILLQTFQTYFCMQANSVDPDQTARSSLIWVHTVSKNDFWNHKQMTKQSTIVVTGALRVKGYLFLFLHENTSCGYLLESPHREHTTRTSNKK